MVEIMLGFPLYFGLLYKKENLLRPKLEGVNFHLLSSKCQRNLEKDFVEDEIVRALKERDGDKAPGQDGLNLSFI